jgi:2-C-methyl-D-erythritol 4-phosphate cytidylyltransferase
VKTALIVPAAGRGERLGADLPKALIDLAGEPLLLRAVRAAYESGVIDVIVVAAPAGHLDAVREWFRDPPAPVIVVPGGVSRRLSVAAALAALPDDVEVVLVHDAARCLTPPRVFADVAHAVTAGAPAVVPVVPLADTIKQVVGDTVSYTLDRSAFRAVQTPQGFARELLAAAHAATTDDASDDAGLVERLGHTVAVVPGHDEAFKITRPLDVELAEAVLRRRAADPTAHMHGPEVDTARQASS